MYKSKNEIGKKLKQVRYVSKEIDKFRGRVFVKGGLDEETGSYPLLTNVGSFLAHARSIFQYAQKEAKETGCQCKYDNYVSQKEIIKFFKGIRDSEIHEYSIGSHMTITGEGPIVSYDRKTHTAIGKKFHIYVESLSDLNTPKETNKDVAIQLTLLKRIEATSSLINDLNAKGETDLAQAASEGKELFEELECNGEKDLFKLCDKYIDEIEQFIKYGIASGFIT